MFKNVASQKITFLLIDTANNVPKTGDSANLTAYVSKDDGAVTVLGDTTATELDATNAPGLYSFDLTQAETNADKLVFSGKSSTANMRVVPVMLYTLPSGIGDLTIANNATAANITRISGSAVSTSTAQLGVNAVNIGGTAQTGRDIGASVLLSSGTGTGQVTLTSGRVNADLTHIATAAVSTSTAQLGVNVVQAGATAWGSGAITAASIATNAIDADALASDAVTEIQSGLATSSALSISAILIEAIHHALVMTEGQADSGTTSTMVDSALTQANDFWNDNILVFITGSNAGRAAVITDFVAGTDTVTFSPVMPNAVAASDGYIIMPGNYVWDALIANHSASGSTGDVISSILTDTAEIGAAGAGLTNINLPNQTMDIVGNITGNLSGSVGSVTGHTPQTGDCYARLGAPAGASVSADIAAIEAQTDDIGAAGAGLSAIPWNAAWDAEVQSEVADALTAFGCSTVTTAQVNAEVVDALATDTYAESSGVPAATASLAAKLTWLATLSRNRITQTATTQTLRNDANSGDIATSAHSDDGTTHVRAEWS